MRTRTTYIALLATVLAGTALTVVSCTPDATAPSANSVAVPAQTTEQKVQELRDKYAWIGQYHTDGLNYIYAQLAKTSSKNRKKDDVCRIVAKALKEFHKKTLGRDVPSNLVDPSLANEVCGDEAAPGSVNKNVVSGFIDIRSPRMDMSYAATSYLNQLSSLPYFATSRSQFMNTTYSIESQAAATLPESEAGAVTAVAAIGRSSADYWEPNVSAWAALSGPTMVPYTIITNGTSGGLGPVYAWGPGAKALGKVLGADLLSGARTAAVSWFLGPVAWDAAAANALWGSGVAGAMLLF